MWRIGQKRFFVTAGLAVLLLGVIVAVSIGQGTSIGARAIVHDAFGAPVAEAAFKQVGSVVRVEVEAFPGSGLPPGYHGLHVHAVGNCVPPAFTSAGGHFNPTGQSHPNHAGDLPVLLVNSDGSAYIEADTARFSVQDILGRALIIHANPDNYANVTRYGSPDAITLATGDAGSRFGCGVIF